MPAGGRAGPARRAARRANKVIAVNGKPTSALPSANPGAVGQTMPSATPSACTAQHAPSSSRLSQPLGSRAPSSAPAISAAPNIGQNRSGHRECAGSAARAITGRKVAVMM